MTASSSGGHDFAWGGAVTGYPGTDDPVFKFPIPTLGDQVSQFITSAGNAPSNALYTFSIGANDLFGMLSDPNLDPADISTDIAGLKAGRKRGYEPLIEATDLNDASATLVKGFTVHRRNAAAVSLE